MRSNTITTTLKLCALVALTLAAIAFAAISRGGEPQTVYATIGPKMDLSIDACTTADVQKLHRKPTCSVMEEPDDFIVAVDLNQLNLDDGDGDTVAGYTGIQVVLTYTSGLTYKSSTTEWDHCGTATYNRVSPVRKLTVSCTIDTTLQKIQPSGESTLTTDILTATFTCQNTTEDQTVQLQAGAAVSDVSHVVNDLGEMEIVNEGYTQALNVDCQPQPDSDSDGCSDAAELGPDPAVGGQRDPKNFWDLFDVWTGTNPPERDRVVSVGDVLATVQRFGASVEPPLSEQDALAEALTSPPPAPAYHASFDRGPGSSGTTVTPPDGAISIGDITAVVSQFGHSCA